MEVNKDEGSQISTKLLFTPRSADKKNTVRQSKAWKYEEATC